MKDLSKEERIEQLEKLISEKDDSFDEEQGRRCIRTFLILSCVIYLIAFMCGEISGIEYLMWLIIAPIMSGIIIIISVGICSHIINGAIRRAETLAELKGRLYELKYGKYK